MDVPIESIDSNDLEDDSGPQIQFGDLWQRDRWLIPRMLPEVPDELEYPAAIQYINTALAGDLDIGDRIPLSESVSEMVDECKDGLILAKLTEFVDPGVIDLHALNKPKNDVPLSMSEMIENHTIISKVYRISQDRPSQIITGCVNGDKAWICILVWMIIWHDLQSTTDETIEKCDVVDLYGFLGQNMTFSQFIDLDRIEIVCKWFNYHLNNSRSHGSAFDVNVNKDGKNYIVLLHQLDPELCSLEPLATEDLVLRAKQILEKAETLRCREFLTPPSLLAGCKNAHLAFIINIFNTYVDQAFKHQIDPRYFRRRLINPSIMKRAYEPLNREIREVRILNILPSKDTNEDIHCFLMHHDLDVGAVDVNGEAMNFLTLSYVWGDVEPMGKVYITGQEISVRPNLVAALRRFRLSENTFELWVDALCIDQGNTEERNHQVGLMDAIYSKSRGVLSWLGEQSETSHLAMTHLNRVEKLVKEETQASSLEPMAYFRSLITDPAYEDHWNALYHLFRRPYWSRLWIVQEVLLNKSRNSYIVCGGDGVPWEWMEVNLVIFNRCLSFAPKTAKEAIGAAEKAIELCKLTLALREANERTIPFLDALVLGRERSATTSADHVYGILSLVHRQGFPAMPKYEESVMSVFRTTMQHIVQTNGNLDILSACQLYNIGNQQCCDDKLLNRELSRTSDGFEFMVKCSAITVEESREKSTDGWDLFKRLASGQSDPHAAPINIVLRFEQDAGRLILPDYLFEVDSGPVEELVAQMKRYQTPWPSWLPDWTLPLHKDYKSSIRYLLLSEPKPQFYSAGGHQKPKIDFDRIMPFVGISGFQFCSIAHLGPVDQWSEDIWEHEHTRWEWYKGLDNVRNPYGNETGKRTAFVLLEILGKDSHGNESTYQSPFPSNTSLLPKSIETGMMSDSHGTQLTDDVPPRRRVAVQNSLDRDLRIWDSFVCKPQTTRPKIESEQSKLGETGEDESKVRRTSNLGEDIEDILNKDHIFMHTTWESRFFATEQGYIGRGPLSIKKGDSVCIFPGGKTPYILCDAGNGGYYLRGECYVQGIMKGEAMMRPHELREFVLR